MTLPKEWQQEADKIMSKYQKEQGEQEYYMYYDVDVPKMMNELATAYKQEVEKAIEKQRSHYNQLYVINYNDKNYTIATVYNELRVLCDKLLTELQTLKPTSND